MAVRRNKQTNLLTKHPESDQVEEEQNEYPDEDRAAPCVVYIGGSI